MSENAWFASLVELSGIYRNHVLGLSCVASGHSLTGRSFGGSGTPDIHRLTGHWHYSNDGQQGSS
ncbi:hypothetical protein [Marinobacter xiaoshiensis]|uniref:Uncharacterized protein n=1 Tax=Marinobacter xiaoshiensis TaxID=3073652 RepID=A0ABU2HHG9_9GAMM|nr:hypothetical protein [Marinobacter sp. F60267]MDS1310085.1 hypothetical protein [Marinobacter sp. F60267]